MAPNTSGFKNSLFYVSFIFDDTAEMVLNSRFPTLSIRELYKSFDTIRLEWKEKSPLQMWSYIYSFGKALFQVVCYPLFEDDQRLNWFSYFIWNYIGVYGILIIYTAYEYIPRGEFSMWLPCTCMMAGPGAAVSSKKMCLHVNVQ